MKTLDKIRKTIGEQKQNIKESAFVFFASFALWGTALAIVLAYRHYIGG